MHLSEVGDAERTESSAYQPGPNSIDHQVGSNSFIIISTSGIRALRLSGPTSRKRSAALACSYVCCRTDSPNL